jgi:hypothetical protein
MTQMPAGHKQHTRGGMWTMWICCAAMLLILLLALFWR